MNGAEILFLIFALATCLGAIAVVVSQNVVRMAFWLMVSLGSVAGLFFLLRADFVAAAQLLIYVGGTVVLLVFGVKPADEFAFRFRQIERWPPTWACSRCSRFCRWRCSASFWPAIRPARNGRCTAGCAKPHRW